jgi:phage shock protein A
MNEVPEPILREGLSSEARRIHERVLALEEQVIAWVEQKLGDVEALDVSARRDQEELHALCYQHLDNYRALLAGSDELLAEERAQFAEAIRDVENLGEQLEYEVNTLATKVEDVEDGVADFERQVLDVEARVGTLEAEEAREGWLQWASRFFMGVGMGLGGW